MTQRSDSRTLGTRLPMQISFDATGPHVLAPFEQAVELRQQLMDLGLSPVEDEVDGAGCAGPVWVVLRIDQEALEAAGGPAAVEALLRRIRSEEPL